MPSETMIKRARKSFGTSSLRFNLNTKHNFGNCLSLEKVKLFMEYYIEIIFFKIIELNEIMSVDTANRNIYLKKNVWLSRGACDYYIIHIIFIIICIA